MNESNNEQRTVWISIRFIVWSTSRLQLSEIEILVER